MYRNTPKKSGLSPAQICMSRNLRTKIPVSDSQLAPELVDVELLKDNIKRQRSYSTVYYNKHTKPLPNVHKGDTVYFKHKPNSVWVPGKISETSSEPRSFVIHSPQGEFRRSRQHILKPVAHAEVLPGNINNNINNTTNQNVNVPNPSTNDRTVMTRSGRVVKPPARFDDYV